MTNQKKRLLNTLNRRFLTGLFICCMAFVAGTIGCSSGGGGGDDSSKSGAYHLAGYDGVAGTTAAVQQALTGAMGNENLKFYAEFPWFVNLTYQVKDAKQKGVSGLTVDNFTVLEDGVEVDKDPSDPSEKNIRKRDALPSAYSYGIKTVLFLDNTPSSSVSVEKMIEAGQVIVDNLDEKGQQKVAIMAYDELGEAEVIEDFTDSRTDLNLALTSDIKPSYGTTNFYSGVIKALSLWEDNHSPSNPAFQQGFLVVVTDGKDTASLSNVYNAVAVRGDKQVIVVAVGNDIDIPDHILNDLKLLGNAGFYHVTDPNLPADEKVDKKENLCENILEAQKKMMAYADGFYWLRYKSLLTSGNANSIHNVVLSVNNNRNDDADSKISGTFNSDGFWSGEPSIYFNTSADDPDGITEKTIMITRGQGAGEVSETIKALTIMQSGNPSQYEWTSGNNGVATVIVDPANTANAIISVAGPGDTLLTVKDTENNVTQTLAIKVKVREESFEMIRHIVTSKGPWFADATFQVRKTGAVDNRWEWTTDLAREDMTVMENGAKIDMETSEVHLRKRDNIPSDYTYTLKTVLLIDNSPSARNVDNLPVIKQAAKAFAKRALENDALDNTDLGPLLDIQDAHQQELAVVSYDANGETIIVQDFTTDLDAVNAAIDGIERGFGPIDFYGGMIESLNLWDNDHSPYDTSNTAFVQGVVVVMSDGWQSNPGFYDRAAVLAETGDKQVICVSVSNDLFSGNSEDLIAFGNAGYYSVPNPGQSITVKVTSDNGKTSKDVTYTTLEKTLMGIQDNAVHPYANSFYWLDYKSKLPPAAECRGTESMVVMINNNSNPETTKHVTGAFASCHFFEGINGALYINSTVTNPDGILPGETIELQYVMLGTIPLDDPTYNLEAFTYDNGDPDDNFIKNTPAYEWAIPELWLAVVTPDPRSYANSRATLSLPATKQQGTTSLRIEDTGNSVFRTIPVKVSGLQLPAPIAYYPFNGNADDETGNGYDGEAFGATLTADRNGKANSAYSFDGNSHIALDMFYGPGDGTAGETIGQITVCAWAKSASSKIQVIAAFDRTEYWRLSLKDYEGTGTGTLNTAWDTTGGDETNDLGTSSSYTNGVWHFICATYQASTGIKNLYVDGALVETIEAHNGLPLGTGLVRYGFIGVGSEATEYNGEKNIPPHWANTCFQGIIDDVIIFHTALTEENIQLLYNASK